VIIILTKDSGAPSLLDSFLTPLRGYVIHRSENLEKIGERNLK
jgi:hypothetical protein